MEIVKKRKQHYIWKKYLRAWAAEEQIYCRRDGKTFKSSLENLAQKRDFYRISELGPKEIFFIEQMIGVATDPRTREFNRRWVEIFDTIFNLKRQLIDSGKYNSEAEDLFDVLQNNFEEEMHKNIEDGADKVLTDIVLGEVGVFENDLVYMQFLHFICVQLVRTKKMRDLMMGSIKSAGVLYPQYTEGVDFEKTANVLTHIFASNIGLSLYRDRYGITFVQNMTETPFITADQPLVNLLATYIEGEPPQHMDLYYPVSPKIGLFFSKNISGVRNEKIISSSDEVIKLNHHMIVNSHEHVFASTEDVLKLNLP
jgi:hypothetical protein